ncbi:MAG TPA: GNAT family N-acetyltransferase [Planctomycetota bacterium]|nr:GNAT family N-acetyltransferase [Planctomycetota bacterium]
MASTALDSYPVSVPLSSKKIILRPMVREDGTALARFFARMPADERVMLKDDVTNPVVIANWCANLDPDKVLPIVALDGSRIVGDVTLHRDRRGWSRHVARIRLTVDPEYRRMGLARAMVRELLVLAERLGVAVVDAEALSAQHGAIKLFEDLGFIAVATLPQHALDLTSQPHDIVVLSKLITPVEQLSPDAHRLAEEVDEGGGG